MRVGQIYRCVKDNNFCEEHHTIRIIAINKCGIWILNLKNRKRCITDKKFLKRYFRLMEGFDER